MFDLVWKELILHRQLTLLSVWHENKMGRGGGGREGGGGINGAGGQNWDNNQPESDIEHKQW